LVHWAAVLACLVDLLMAGVGCGGGSVASQAVSGPTAPTLASIAITPASVPQLVIGSSQQFTATGKYSDGSTQTLTYSVSWSSSAPAVAAISSSGLATALTAGQASIKASMGTVNATPASLTVTAPSGPGSLGSATATSIACPTSAAGISGTCYSVALSCPDTSDLIGYVKVTFPTGTPVGTVVFTTGGSGTDLYESHFTYGPTTLNAVLGGGYTLAQISWGEPFTTGQTAGWVTGPGGMRAVGCRYATLAQWIYNNIHLANTAAPFCATGNSGGAAEIGLALAHYGMGSIFAMVEPTSGPPFSRQDWGCDCSHPQVTDPCGNTATNYCVGLGNAQDYIDPAYTAPVSCSYEVENRSTIYDSTFLNDSVLSPDAELNYPNTFVNIRYGGADRSCASNQGHLWYSAITSSKAESCIAGAPHEIPSDQTGAQDIANDLLKYCKLPAGQQKNQVRRNAANAKEE
jgi:hypothetical protein